MSAAVSQTLKHIAHFYGERPKPLVSIQAFTPRSALTTMGKKKTVQTIQQTSSMKCPECDREMTPKESGPDRARNGKTYDWKKFTCIHDDTWVETWTTPEEA